jgi:GNAT superfamily N-acetyltransferase
MNMYRDYILTRERLNAIERDNGFLLWRIDEKPERHLFISDYYVDPSHRRKGLGYSMADEAFEIARQNGCKLVMCQCDEEANGSELSYFTIRNYGFKEYHKDNGVVTLFMEV